MAITNYTLVGVNGEPMMTLLPKGWKGDGTVTGLIYCHGAGGDELEPRNPNAPFSNMMRIVEAIADAGTPVIVCKFGGDLWANSASRALVTAASTYMRTTMGAKADKVGFLGQSMGHLTAMNWVAEHRSETAFVVSSMGVCDLNNIANSGYKAMVDTAYPGGYSDAVYGATCNPTINAASKFAGLPWLGFAGNNDQTCPAILTRNLKNAIGSSAKLRMSAGAHDWVTIGGFDIPAVLAFIRANS